MLVNYNFEPLVTNNLKRLKLNSLILPITLLFLIGLFLFIKNAFSVESYINFQKNSFFYLNSKLSQLPTLQYNLTQLGDVLIFAPFFVLSVIYAPKFWHSLITSLILSAIFTNLLKKIFAVPRPAGFLNTDDFIIIGKTLSGHNSLPSGHSIATFTILTVALIAFMPKKTVLKMLWSFLILSAGLIIAFSRVGVGAHYPIDVIVGSIIGAISAIIGILITQKINIWTWMTTKKYYPITIILFSIWAIVLIIKIVAINLAIFYFSLIILLATIFIITYTYVKK